MLEGLNAPLDGVSHDWKTRTKTTPIRRFRIGPLGLIAIPPVKWPPNCLDTLGTYGFVSDVLKCLPYLGHNRFAGRSSGEIVAREQSVAQSVFIIGI
jgi:hypothetical protein